MVCVFEEFFELLCRLFQLTMNFGTDTSYHVVAVGQHGYVGAVPVTRLAPDQAVGRADRSADAADAVDEGYRPRIRRRAVVPTREVEHELPLVSSSGRQKPCMSFLWVPTRLLAALTTPLTPVRPLPKVTAPASVAEPLSHFGLATR